MFVENKTNSTYLECLSLDKVLIITMHSILNFIPKIVTSIESHIIESK